MLWHLRILPVGIRKPTFVQNKLLNFRIYHHLHHLSRYDTENVIQEDIEDFVDRIWQSYIFPNRGLHNVRRQWNGNIY